MGFCILCSQFSIILVQKQKHYKHHSSILVEFWLKMITFFGENEHVMSKIQIPNFKKKNEQKTNATLKQSLRGLFFAVLTPVQILPLYVF